MLTGLEGSQYVMPRWYEQNDKGRKKHQRREFHSLEAKKVK